MIIIKQTLFVLEYKPKTIESIISNQNIMYLYQQIFQLNN